MMEDKGDRHQLSSGPHMSKSEHSNTHRRASGIYRKATSKYTLQIYRKSGQYVNMKAISTLEVKTRKKKTIKAHSYLNT